MLPVVRAEGRYICACVAAQWEGSRKITTFLVGQSGGRLEGQSQASDYMGSLEAQTTDCIAIGQSGGETIRAVIGLRLQGGSQETQTTDCIAIGQSGERLKGQSRTIDYRLQTA